MGRPLIGDAQMLAIYETMVRLRALQPGAPTVSNPAAHAMGVIRPRPIALLAATLLQLRPIDIVLADGEDSLAAEVLALAQAATFSPESQTPCLDAGVAAAAIAAGYALAQQRMTRAGDDAPVTVALLRDSGEDLTDVLHLAGASVLPLVVIVQCGRVSETPLLESLENVEVVRIDADDAVACCRVMQESLLRARNRWGAVVLQAVTLPNAVDPITALESHLRRRKLAFQDEATGVLAAATR